MHIWVPAPCRFWALNIRNGREQRQHKCFKFVETLSAEHAQPHRVRRVVLCMESDESVANQERWFAHAPDRHMHTAKPSGRQTERNWTGRKIGKRRCVPCAEFVLRVVVPSKRSCQLSHPPLVGLQVLGVFRVDGLELALSCPLGEQRRKEELRKSVQSPSELARHHIKVEIRVFEGGVSIRSATVHGEKALVLGLVRVLGGAQKEHVLEKMCQTRKFGRVRGVSHGNIH
mmetsp:Transcript_14130/g.43193  ORF Transcript_14130/g.43193 Transcript_14130/m.43193 type:complete len:230 (+) Transcript_14130:2494-3183(+)